MIPYQNFPTSAYAPLSSLQALNYPDLDSTTAAFGTPLLQGGAPSADPNSPEAFRQNIQLAQQHVLRVQALARAVLAGIENAYHPGTSPLQTAADAGALGQALLALVDVLRQTGVGALPLAGAAPEEERVAETARAVQGLYDRYKRMQESAGVVAGLLGAGEQGRR